MATAAGLVMGDMKRAGRSIFMVACGVAGTIATAWFIGTFLNTTVVSFTTNTQIISRISPNLTDLAVALASGAAGAFAMSRSDVADSLPGVAISIALVPPLGVVGIGLSQGQWGVAWGAMLLFLTNFLSILLAGGGVLALLGLSAASIKELTGTSRRKAFTYIAIGVLVVTIPLAATSITLSNETMAELQTQHYVQQWLAETQLELTSVQANGNQIEVIIHGVGEPPPPTDLDPDLSSALGPQAQVIIKIVPSQAFVFPEPVSE